MEKQGKLRQVSLHILQIHILKLLSKALPDSFPGQTCYINYHQYIELLWLKRKLLTGGYQIYNLRSALTDCISLPLVWIGKLLENLCVITTIPAWRRGAVDNREPPEEKLWWLHEDSSMRQGGSCPVWAGGKTATRYWQREYRTSSWVYDIPLHPSSLFPPSDRFNSLCLPFP